MITSIMITNNNGLSADPWWSPTSIYISLVSPTLVMSLVLHPSHMSLIMFMQASGTPFRLSEYNISSFGALTYTFSVQHTRHATPFRTICVFLVASVCGTMVASLTFPVGTHTVFHVFYCSLSLLQCVAQTFNT